MELLSLSGRRSSTRNVPAAKSTEKRMFSQASVVEATVQLEPICILTCSLRLVLFFLSGALLNGIVQCPDIK